MGPINAEIAELALDLENPRLEGARSQREALQKIIDDQKDKLVILAESLVDEGTNPMDRLLVLRDPKLGAGLVVLEGNRRVAALRILANPTVLDDLHVKTSIRRSFDALARSFDPSTVEPLSCFQVKDRESGNMWIHLRHTGENGGKGVVGWSGLAASRFRGQDPALQALEFVRAFGGLTNEQKDRIEHRFPITTLDRLLSSREVRRRLAFDVKDGKLVTSVPPAELMKPLRRMVLDLAEKRVNVSRLKNSAQQIEYVQSFDVASRPDVAKAGTVREVEGIGVGDFSAKPPLSRRKKVASDPSARRKLVPKGLRLCVTDNRSAAILRELRLMNVDDTPNAIAVLFRVFLELSVDGYMERHALPSKYRDPKSGKSLEKSLRQRIQEVVEHLLANGGNRKDYASVLRALSVEQSPLYIDLLHAYVHNRFTTPKSHDLIASWDEAQRFLEGLWP